MADLLVVGSKVKKYIKDKAQMNTSSSTLASLSQVVQNFCDKAIATAQGEGRKTVMDRDVPSDSSAGSPQGL